MSDFEWTILQNGADIRGVATDGVIGEKVTLTTDKVMALGNAFVRWLWSKGKKRKLRIAIGTDCRTTGMRFMDSIELTIIETGCDVLNCGLASTPAMQMSTSLMEVRADAAIMFTGSHMAFNRNGMKFFYDGRSISRDDLSEIIQLAQEGVIVGTGEGKKGTVHILNLLAIYSQLLRNKIDKELEPLGLGDRPLEGLKIVVDAGNGAGAFYASRVLRPLGADISESQFLNPDGRFPNHTPNPENLEAMRSIAQKVQLVNADLGILFDADVDRMAIVDNEGRNINRNELVALISAIVLEEHPGTTIVTDSITSTGLGIFITDILGGKHHRFQRGYRNVINEAMRLNDSDEPCWLAVETSGHAAFRENDFVDDGAFFATKLVIKLAQLKAQGRSLFSLIERLPVPLESKEVRIPILADDYQRVANEIISGLRQFVSQIRPWEEVNQNYEGLRVMCQSPDEMGWFLCRLSLHEAELSITIESDIAGGVKKIISTLKLFFRNFQTVDSSRLYT